MKVLVAQLGARRDYAVARALHQAGVLDRLVTDSCSALAPWRWLRAVLPNSLRPAAVRGVLGRTVGDVPAACLSGFPWFALAAAWERRWGEAPTDFWARRNAAFAHLVAHRGFGSADTVYGYNGAALEMIQAAHRQGKRTVLDQTAAPWRWNRALLTEEVRRWPGWEDQPAEVDVSGALSEREEAEWALADRVICGSAFALSALAESGGPVECCSVVRYPRPVAGGAGRLGARRRRGAEGPLRVLFVGTLQLRKGVQYLLEAKRLLRGESLTVRLVGPSVLSESIMRDLRSETEVIGAVPRSEVARHYAWADVFVLPTLSEGSANVCYEAMSAGLPVITTPHAGVAIRHGEDGLLVPIRDPESLARALSQVIDDEEARQKLCPADVTVRGLAQYGVELQQAVM